ncbi:MAG: prolyl oligopeptidase family serine peptidase [Acidobacteria bacterium]|nr:prolyl oligopeptidase family serine peptidase [Acidobacteriota bacterium]
MKKILLLVVLVLVGTGLSFGQKAPTLLPGDPNSDERWAPIELFKKQAPPLAVLYEAGTYRDAKGEVMPYRLFKPKTEPGRRYPLVLFLHGSGGSGTDNLKQLERANWFGGLVWALPDNQRRHPCFVVAPQSNENWPPVRLRDGQLPEILLGPGRDRLAIEIVEKLAAELPVDRSRIYVTGHSMGGAGTWHVLAERPDLFAAGVPVCGRAHPATLKKLIRMPIWNFHGELDKIEPVATSRDIIAELRRLGGQPLYSEYPGVEHNVFMWVYTEPALVEWLFAQHK